MKINIWALGYITLLFGVVGYFTSSSVIEFISAITGLLCVWLAAKENIWNYPIGFINIAAFMYIFFGAKLYADFTLQIFFAILSAYGWIVWLTKREGKPIRATRIITTKEAVVSGIFLIIGTLGWALVLANYTDASIPFADAFIATLSIIAQVFLSKKVLQNWHIWIVVDVLSIGMYFYKGLTVVAILYIAFLINAIYGYLNWKSIFMKQERTLNDNR